MLGILLFLQAAVVVALFVAEDLTHKKAGVNHHLYYRRAQFNNNVLTEERIVILSVLLVIAIGALGFFLWKRRGASKALKGSFVLEILWMAVALVACHMEFFRSSYVYPYMMAAFAFCIVLSAIQILLLKK